MRAYFRYQECQDQRKRMERLWHPELLKWAKGKPPTITETKQFRREELAKVGFGEEFYQKMLHLEQETEKELCSLAEMHCLWPHFQHISGIATPLTTGKYVARGGDIARANTVSGNWKGLGEDLLLDGTVPRRKRGKRFSPKSEEDEEADTEEATDRRIPALPHVTMIGEQIRQQIVKRGRSLKHQYDLHKADYKRRNPDFPKWRLDKHGKRIALKILDSTAWKVWREHYGLPAPDPYAFAILRHPDGNLIRIEDLYDKEPGHKGYRPEVKRRAKKEKTSQSIGATGLVGEPDEVGNRCLGRAGLLGQQSNGASQ